MTEIYSRADKVLVHLGEEDEKSDDAMECIEDFGRAVSEDDAELVGQFLRRSWFGRIWVSRMRTKSLMQCANTIPLFQVVQEVARSRVAVVVCGTYCVAWDCFTHWPFRAISRKYMPPLPHLLAVGQEPSKDIPSVLYYASGYTPSTGSDSLLQILHENRSAHTTDNRDKIFGTLGLMADITHYEHLIDYGKRTPDVYVDFAWQILKDTQSLRTLSLLRVWDGVHQNTTFLHGCQTGPTPR
jgi:hypothetical protein